MSALNRNFYILLPVILVILTCNLSTNFLMARYPYLSFNFIKIAKLVQDKNVFRNLIIILSTLNMMSRFFISLALPRLLEVLA